MIHTLILVVHVLAAIGLIVLVLLQQGKGADAGAAFGSGASATVFGSQGSGSFMTRTTAILATIFFLTSLALASPYVSQHVSGEKSVVDMVQPSSSSGKTSDKGAVPPAASGKPAEQQSQPGAPAVPAKPAPASDVPVVPGH